ncbi:hypothetical protein MMIC_P1093 [Mariprofundus micogutta]|uniref:Uncharacterized protein n=1 Tax=Mariprofundus micogutta TaxID=1921010 RepID=A0A1L8CMJ6_9PROT|nr:hypothetical protein MMIC_P1093 [Mariprofundus micogutta]
MRYIAMCAILSLSFLAAVQVSNAQTETSETTVSSTNVVTASSSEALLPVSAAQVMIYHRSLSI